MLAVNWDTIRLFLHVVAATIWVGGQITLAALVPVLRKAGSEVSKAAADGFNRIAWPAFGVLILTGIWNVIAEHDKDHGAYHTTLIVKIRRGGRLAASPRTCTRKPRARARWPRSAR